MTDKKHTSYFSKPTSTYDGELNEFGAASMTHDFDELAVTDVTHTNEFPMMRVTAPKRDGRASMQQLCPGILRNDKGDYFIDFSNLNDKDFEKLNKLYDALLDKGVSSKTPTDSLPEQLEFPKNNPKQQQEAMQMLTQYIAANSKQKQ